MATQVQASVAGALQQLKFESANEPGDPPGGPHKLKVTAETVEKVKSLEGKTITVDSGGNVEV